MPDVECIEWAGLGIAVANAGSGSHQRSRLEDSETQRKRELIRECAEKIIEINEGERE